MDTSKKTKTVRIIIFAVIVLGIAVLMTMVAKAGQREGKYDSFAQCMAGNNVRFYGAFWCPHCQAQEKALEATRQKLADENLYVECSTADAKGQTPACIAKNITGYPTWEFADGSRVTGEQTLATLAEKSGCALPQ